jgi:hypothetical protein
VSRQILRAMNDVPRLTSGLFAFVAFCFAATLYVFLHDLRNRHSSFQRDCREPLEMEGGTTFYFVTEGIQGALERAKKAARGKDVSLAGGADGRPPSCVRIDSRRAFAIGQPL